MFIIPTEKLVVVDVDDTLILWREVKKTDRIVKFKDPYDGKSRIFVIHRPHVKLVRDYKARGFKVMVWSAGGYRWAVAVVKALKLEKYVDFVTTKPSKHVDDIASQGAEGIVGSRVYIKY